MSKIIKRLIKEKDISYLLHFTRRCNLKSILENGLYPSTSFPALGQPVTVNDDLRLDFHPDAISLSISFPNYLMFYKLRQDNPDEDWVVLVLHRKILWQQTCAFCKHNAADARISNVPTKDLMGENALQGMFEEIENMETREEQKLKPQDPTDPQAEVLVFGEIPIKYIRGVVFSKKNEKESFIDQYSGIKAYYHPEGKGVFASRSYIRKYDN